MLQKRLDTLGKWILSKTRESFPIDLALFFGLIALFASWGVNQEDFHASGSGAVPETIVGIASGILAIFLWYGWFKRSHRLTYLAAWLSGGVWMAVVADVIFDHDTENAGWWFIAFASLSMLVLSLGLWDKERKHLKYVDSHHHS